MIKFRKELIISVFIGILFVCSCKSDSKSNAESQAAAQALPEESQTGQTYAVTLDGKRLLELPEPDSIKERNKKNLDDSRMFYLGHLTEVKSFIAYGYQCIESGLVENAIQVLSKGIEQFQNTADLYLYRGIASVQGRQFASAVNDFWKAGKAVEGQKDIKGLLEKSETDKKINASLHYEIYKWMGLAFQCQGDFSNAEKMYEVCGDFSNNSDLYCMAYYWQYQSYMRANRQKDAEGILTTIEPKMFITPVTKPYLDALLYYKGSIKEVDLVNLEEKPKSSAEARDWTIKAYAIAVKAIIDNKQARQIQVLEKILESPFWNQMPYIAAEADYHAVKGFKYQEMQTKEINSNSKKSK